MSWFPLKATHLSLAGADRSRYLNGQVTNQIADLPSSTSRYACITNHKGQLEADLHITAWSEQETLHISAHSDLQDSLHARLERYIIADDAELTDVTNHWQLIHLLGATAFLPDLPEDSHQSHCERLGRPGIDLFIPKESAPKLSEQLTATHGPALTHEAIENQRIQNAIPAWGQELTPGLLPPEARLESRAINYEKGCYTGQEIISRMRTSGKVNRLLVLIDTSQANPALTATQELTSPDNPEKPIGHFTTLGTNKLALAYVKTAYSTPDTQLQTTDGAPVTILPFPS